MKSSHLHEIRNWFENGTSSQLIEDNFCSNRSVFNGRLSSYESTIKKSLSEDCLFLTSASIGEIGNNCFDHNLGFWQSSPGCLFIREEKFCIIADRGQGIKGSLSKVYSLKPDENKFIDIAFNKVITGRAPEKRGNGLKFAKKNLLSCGLYLYCTSHHEEFAIGTLDNPLFSALTKPPLNNSGTLTLIAWGK